MLNYFIPQAGARHKHWWREAMLSHAPPSQLYHSRGVLPPSSPPPQHGWRNSWTVAPVLSCWTACKLVGIERNHNAYCGGNLQPFSPLNSTTITRPHGSTAPTHTQITNVPQSSKFQQQANWAPPPNNSCYPRDRSPTFTDSANEWSRQAPRKGLSIVSIYSGVV